MRLWTQEWNQFPSKSSAVQTLAMSREAPCHLADEGISLSLSQVCQPLRNGDTVRAGFASAEMEWHSRMAMIILVEKNEILSP